jgi:hypothetical protein
MRIHPSIIMIDRLHLPADTVDEPQLKSRRHAVLHEMEAAPSPAWLGLHLFAQNGRQKIRGTLCLHSG